MTHRPRRLLFAVALLGAALATGLFFAVDLALGEPEVTCPPIAEHPEWSVARRWDEVLLDAIRRDLPAPTKHSRNLYHVSAAMWDAWAAYDLQASGVFFHEKHTADDVEAARNEAISYAAYRILEHRYIGAVGAPDSIPEFDALMAALCYPIDVTTTEATARPVSRQSPRARGTSRARSRPTGPTQPPRSAR